jgi:hypothetical protein
MSRRFSPRMFPNAITIQSVSYGQDAAGGRTRTLAAGVDYAASVQLDDPRRLQPFQGATASEVEGLVELPVDPGTKHDDLLTWRVVPGDATRDRKFTVLGPATPEAGRDSLYTVPVKQWK